MMGKNETTSAVAILALFDLLNDHGFSAAQVKIKTGIDRAKMEDPDARIPMEQFLSLWQMAETVTQDPAIGLHLRQNYGHNYVHFAIMIARNCDTLLDAVRSWSEYAMLVNDTDRVLIHEQENHVVCTYTCSSPEYENKWIPEHHFSYMVHSARRISGRDFSPVSVWFRHEDPGYSAEYERVLGCPVRFSMNENMMTAKKTDMMRPIISPDPYLKILLKKHADGAVLKHPMNNSMKEQVRALISEKLHQGEISAKAVSENLNMDRSTLHRHLKKEGASFREILSEVRRDLAKQYLLQGLNASQTAYMLGFTEPSTFHRAFKRWYGTNPGAFRKSVHQL